MGDPVKMGGKPFVPVTTSTTSGTGGGSGEGGVAKTKHGFTFSLSMPQWMKTLGNAIANLFRSKTPEVVSSPSASPPPKSSSLADAGTGGSSSHVVAPANHPVNKEHRTSQGSGARSAGAIAQHYAENANPSNAFGGMAAGAAKNLQATSELEKKTGAFEEGGKEMLDAATEFRQQTEDEYNNSFLGAGTDSVDGFTSYMRRNFFGGGKKEEEKAGATGKGESTAATTTTAATSKATTSTAAKAATTTPTAGGTAADAKEGLDRRGQKLGELGEKTAALKEGAIDFQKNAAAYRKKLESASVFDRMFMSYDPNTKYYTDDK